MRHLPFALLLGLAPAPALTPALAQDPEMMSRCELGAAVMVPGFQSAGVISEEKSGMCLVDMGNGNITAMPPEVLARAARPEGARAETEGAKALIEGYWACRFADGSEGFELYLAPGRYDTMAGSSGEAGSSREAGSSSEEGSTGELLPHEADPLAVRFVGGPYDGLSGTVSNATLSFQPPEASGPASCMLRP